MHSLLQTNGQCPILTVIVSVLFGIYIVVFGLVVRI